MNIDLPSNTFQIRWLRILKIPNDELEIFTENLKILFGSSRIGGLRNLEFANSGY